MMPDKEKRQECNDTGEVFDEIDKTLGHKGLEVKVKKLQAENKKLLKTLWDVFALECQSYDDMKKYRQAIDIVNKTLENYK